MITSLSNSRVKSVAALNQKAKERRQQGKYVVEGIKMFLEAPLEEMEEVYVSERLAAELMESKRDGAEPPESGQGTSVSDMCRERLEGLAWETVSDEVFRKMSDTATPQGILCVMRMKQYRMEELLGREKPFLMVLEDIQDPGNLGTILRTGEGAGIDGVILSKESADIYNPKTIRSTMGSIYRVPFVYTSDMESAAGQLKKHGVSLYAAHLKGEKWYDEADYTGGCAFLIGNEGNGLKPETAALAGEYIKIPMQGKVESLNAAMASGILMYEAARQRRIL